MNKEYLELTSLAGLPIKVDGIGKVYPIKLFDIAEITEYKYNQYLNVLCINVDDLNLDKEIEYELKKNDISSFSLILHLYNQDETGEFFKIFKDALKFFLKQEVIFVPYLGTFFIGENEDLESILKDVKNEKDLKKIENILDENNFINEKKYDNFKEVLILQNCIEKKNIKDEKYANEKAREIAEKIKLAKEKINKIKSKQGETLSLFDLISAFSGNSKSTNIINVWDMTIFQFNDQFKRMQMIEEYDINIRSLLAGADSNKVNLEHWIRKIKN